MPYAIIRIKGKQHKVQVGDIITTDRLTTNEGGSVVIDDVLLSVDDSEVRIGTPKVADTTVTTKVVAHTRGEKIRVATFKAKSRYRKTKGHRQDQTQLEVVSIGGSKPKLTRKKTVATKPAAVK